MPQDLFQFWGSKIINGLKVRATKVPSQANTLMPPYRYPSLGAFLQSRHDWERDHRDFHIVAQNRVSELQQHVGRPAVSNPESEKDHDSRRRKQSLPVQANAIAQANWKSRDNQ